MSCRRNCVLTSSSDDVNDLYFSAHAFTVSTSGVVRFFCISCCKKTAQALNTFFLGIVRAFAFNSLISALCFCSSVKTFLTFFLTGFFLSAGLFNGFLAGFFAGFFAAFFTVLFAGAFFARGFAAVVDFDLGFGAAFVVVA